MSNATTISSENPTIQSWTVQCLPHDRRCRYWAKIIRADNALPWPEHVHGAHDIPGSFLPRGEEELFPGDVLIDGEANHHIKNRGTTYCAYVLSSDGKRFARASRWSEFKAAVKAHGGFDPNLLKGSGDLAACVRFAHLVRLGIWPAAQPKVDANDDE